MRNFIQRHRRVLTVGGIFGVIFALAGAAVAAFVLTTTISGSTAFAGGTNIADKITAVEGTASSTLDCKAISVAGGGEAVNFNPKMIRQSVQGTPQDYAGGECTVKATLQNTGDVPLRFKSGALSGAGVDGWKFVPQGVPGTIAPGASVAVTVKVTAPANAKAGTLTGSFTTEEVVQP